MASSAYLVFSDPSLLIPPVKRAAYSDRMALLMAEMSKLAYINFEVQPQPDQVEAGELDHVTQAIKEAEDSSEARRILVKFAEDTPAAARERASRGLRCELARGGFELVNTYEVGETQAFLALKRAEGNWDAHEEGISVLSFRGTQQNLRDWKTNLNALKEIVEGVPIHTGFLQAFRLVKNEIKTDLDRLSSEGCALYLTGHSLGGALALIATREVGNDSTGSCYTFGSPRVAGYGFAQKIKTPIYRVVNANDLVPWVPSVFAPIFLKFVVSVTPVPYQHWVIKLLGRLDGYVHHGDMRYLTRSKMESRENYEDIRLLSNPNMVHRIYWWIKRSIRKPKSAITDHSIDTYCKKLKAYALKRASYP